MKLKSIVGSLALLGLATHVVAQTASPQRVEITGSSIKRIQSEGALPIQVITREEIDRQGIISAEQLVATLSANGNGVDNMVSNQGGDFLNSTSTSGRTANNGSASASLRGLGPQYTLILLNGRRVSTHGLNGAAPDLNTIPMAAVQRIEILKDGASAIYGTDAIGGVINFILRKDYTGFEASATADVTQHGGGNVARGNLVFGVGSLDTDRFNLLAGLTLDKQDRLRGNQRSFHNGFQPERGLAPDTTGTPFATINVAGGTALPAAFTLPGTTTSYNRVNLLALQGKCETIPNTYAYRGDITGSNNNNKACAYDYGKDWSLQQPVDRTNFVGRGVFKLSEEHTFFGEATASRTVSKIQYTSNQITTVARGANYPASGQYYLDLTGLVPGFDKTKPERLRWRCEACGTRQQKTTADVYRMLVGMEGVLAGFDYKWGLSSAGSKASTMLLDGNLDEVKFKAAMETGKINPFLLPGQSQTAEAMALIESAKVFGSLYGGKATLTQADGTISGEIFKLPAGAVSMALGFDVRKEGFRFKEDRSEQPAIIGVTAPPSLAQAKRDVRAFFGELAVPIVKGLDAQLAVRNDHYSDFGSTTNPKVGLRWELAPSFLMRGSYSTGFHAPDFGALYAGESTGQFTSDVNDPVLCPGGVGTSGCKIRPATRFGGNPALKPETSKQFSVGFVVAPTVDISASVDFWKITLEDRISSRTPQEVLANHTTLGQYIVRDASGQIDYVRGGIINVAGDETKGFDLSLAFQTRTGFGRLKATLDGTYVDSYRTRKFSNDRWTERVGAFGDFDFGWDLKLRWKHTAGLTWSNGPWSTTISQVYSSGYKEEVDGYGSGVILQDMGFQSKIKSYTLYNLLASYSGIKDLKITAGIKNLLDTKPSFTLHNVDNVAGAGWDARVGDPRLRSFVLTATYKFF